LDEKQRSLAETNYRMSQSLARHNIPDRAYLDIPRNPLLVLHVVSVDKVKTDDKGNLRSQIDEGVTVPDYLFALGIGIPANGEEKTANYMVNLVEFRNYYDFEDEEDE
jgi:Trm5-related predicted tRNA methylase